MSGVCLGFRVLWTLWPCFGWDPCPVWLQISHLGFIRSVLVCYCVHMARRVLRPPTSTLAYDTKGGVYLSPATAVVSQEARTEAVGLLSHTSHTSTPRSYHIRAPPCFL